VTDETATILAVDDDPDALFILVSKPVNTRDLLARIRAQLHQLRLAREIDAILRDPGA